MDASADVFYGPNPLQKSGTVTVPRELMREVGLEQGDRVHWALNPDIPGTLVLVPSELLARTMDEVFGSLRRHSE